MTGDPDRPWDHPVDYEPIYVYRVRYRSNQVEILELVNRSRTTLFVRDPESKAEATIDCRDVFDTFGQAKARLVELNTDRVAQVERDLAEAQSKLSLSQRIYMDEEDE